MFRPRIIPCLLILENKLVKTTQFDNPRYIGDPLNAVHIFNQKEADELIFLDIGSTRLKYPIQYDLLRKISNECLMPFSYGGGITSFDQIEKLFLIGCEKVILNTGAYMTPDLVKKAQDSYGSQSIICSIDIRNNNKNEYRSYISCGQMNTKIHPFELAKKFELLGAGELMITSINNDGMMQGYDIELLNLISNAVSIPVIGCGGAGNYLHFKEAITLGGVSAVAAGSLFLYHGRKKAVLISYPSKEEMLQMFV